MVLKAFVTRKIPEEGLNLLKERGVEVEMNEEDRVLTKEEVIRGIKGKDGLLCLLTDKIDAEVMDAGLPTLKIISNYAVGYDNIDVRAATERKIPVTNTPEVLTEATAEMTWALLFSVARRVVEGDKFCRAGKYKGWGPLLMRGMDIRGKTLGIAGAGRIGTAFGLKSKGFGMKVLYADTRNNELLEREVGAEKVELEELLKSSDFVSLHTPLIPETRHLIGEKELKMMKESAILINASRGPVIDEKALARALKEHWIWGAGLDVYENEPAVEPELVKLNNVILAPHLGSATFGARADMATLAAENLLAVLEGKTPPKCVNPEVFENE